MTSLYLFTSTVEWDTQHTVGIVAESKEQAKELYCREFGDYEQYEVVAVEIECGLMIVPGGYDATWISTKRML